jgi:hypothetical protein
VPRIGWMSTNTKTAKLLDLAIPPTISVRAARVIE